MIDNSLKIGKYLLEVLNDDEDLMTALGEDKIWPLAAREGTLFPYVIYTRDTANVQYTKVVGHDNTLTITYRVYSNDYDEGLNIVNMIRNKQFDVNLLNKIRNNN